MILSCENNKNGLCVDCRIRFEKILKENNLEYDWAPKIIRLSKKRDCLYIFRRLNYKVSLELIKLIIKKWKKQM